MFDDYSIALDDYSIAFDDYSIAFDYCFYYARRHLSAKILYTVEPKTATSPCVHFQVAASPTEKKHHLHVSIFSRFEIEEIIDSNTREIISFRF